MSVRATPFHVRAAASNSGNDWIARNGYTLARVYSGVPEETLAARSGAIMADISWRWRVILEGRRVGDFLSRLTTKNANALSPVEAHKALWLSDAGGLRGAGVIARYGRESFLLAAASPDVEWMGDAAQRFDVTMRDAEGGGIAIIGPAAKTIVESAGLDTALEPLAFRKLFWRGVDVTLSRWGEHGGFEIWCDDDDGVIVWDRIAKAGAEFGMLPAGTTAMDILDMEAGVARPHRDYQPAQDGRAAEPSPKSLRLEKLVGEDHTGFNGYAAYAAASPSHRIVGIELDSETPAPDTILYKDGVASGRMMTSLYSPSLRRAIGWARLEKSASEVGTRLSLLFGSDQVPVAARVADLPFLAVPAPIEP
jgi:aminomethyltransferase